MAHSSALVIHLLGVLLWVGGSASAAWVAARLALAAKDARDHGLAAVRSALLALATPGLVLAWAGGLTMLIMHWSDLYAHAGWMHGKLTVALVVSGLSGVVTGRIRRAASGKGDASPGLMTGLALAHVIGALVILGLVVFRPGS